MKKIKNVLPFLVVLLLSCSKQTIPKKEPIFSSGEQLVGRAILTKEQFEKFIKDQEDSCKCKIKF